LKERRGRKKSQKVAFDISTRGEKAAHFLAVIEEKKRNRIADKED